jgi:hypothetical protein
MVKKPDFKHTASSIFKDVLEDKQMPERDSSKFNQKDVQMHMDGPVKEDTPDVRLHCYIRWDIENKLLDEVDRRKRDLKIPRAQANKRAIVEEALEKSL